MIKLHEKDDIPIVKIISYEQSGETFSRLKAALNIERYLKSNHTSELQARGMLDTLGLSVLTDVIQQVTFGDHVSYTMEILNQKDTIVFYNLTMENKNEGSSMFITKYVPEQDWLINKEEVYRGAIFSRRINVLTQATDLENMFDDNLTGGNNNHEVGIGVGGGGGSVFLPNYPSNCNGNVIVSMKLIKHACASGGHMPGQNCEYLNPTYENYNPSYGPYEEFVPFYYCQEYGNGGINDSPGGSGGGGASNPIAPTDTSIAAMIKPVECTKRIKGDLNGDCMLSPYEMCLLNGNSTEVCDCVEAGGNLDTCFDINDCKNLNNLLASDKTNLNKYISQLVAKHNSDVKKEYIYSLRKEIQDYDIDTGEATYNYLPPFEAEGTATSIQVQVDTKTYADIHLHTKDEGAASSIFSWGDIYEFNKFYDGISKAQPIATFKKKNDIMTMLVAPDAENLNNYNVYALTIGDKTALQTAVQNEWNSPKWAHITNVKERKEAINQDVGEKYVNYKECVERFFLDNFSTYGIKLYKMENNQWNELLVNTDTMDKVSKKTCD